MSGIHGPIFGFLNLFRKAMPVPERRRFLHLLQLFFFLLALVLAFVPTLIGKHKKTQDFRIHCLRGALEEGCPFHRRGPSSPPFF